MYAAVKPPELMTLTSAKAGVVRHGDEEEAADSSVLITRSFRLISAEREFDLRFVL